MPYPIVKTYAAKSKTVKVPAHSMPHTGAMHPKASDAKMAVKRPMNTHSDGKPNAIR